MEALYFTRLLHLTNGITALYEHMYTLINCYNLFVLVKV